MTATAATKYELSSPWRSCRFVSIDLETTGTDPRNDRIIEIGIVIFENGVAIDRWQKLVNPERELPAVVTEVTGIKPEDLEGKPKLADVVDEMLGWLRGELLLAYNHEFDLGVISAEMARLGIPWENPPCLDPFPFAWEYLRETGITKNAQLGTVCAHLGINLDNAHRADHDAEAAAQILPLMAKTISLPESLGDLLQMQRALWQKVNEAFARFRRGKATEGRSMFAGGEGLVIELGAAYIYGDEADPVRALFQRIPDVRDM